MSSWKNWAGNQRAKSLIVERPTSEEEITNIVRRAADVGKRVKVVGSGHSFTGIAVPEQIMIELSRFNKVVEIDSANGRVTVQSGIVLSDLNAILEQHNLSMPNLGDVTYQTVAGSLSTSTHGTGLERSGLAAQILSFRLVVARGEVLFCDPSNNAEIFHCGRVSLGALGVITEITLRVVPAFNLRAIERPMRIDEVLNKYEQLIRTNDFFEFYWVPHTKWALTKSNNVTTDPIDVDGKIKNWWNKMFLENIAFGMLCRVGRRIPALIPKLATIIPSTGRVEYVNISHRVFSSKRLVKFYEMEYSIELKGLVPALREIMAMVDRRKFKISFPVEVRCTGPDDIPLSTSTGRQSAYIAVHMFKGCEYDEYFTAGRPHWGKLHYLDASALSGLYPEYQRFIEVRNQLDPEGVFTNDYLRRVLGC
ncbi:MAG: FAD-binding protein [Actinobacteria bacterium]|nr:FAD-binding protein [Actinomycetota bacterium]